MSTPVLSKWISLACIAVPTAAVVVARSVLPSAGPRGASASTPLADKTPPHKRDHAPAPLLRQDTAKLLAEIDQLRETPPAQSPFVSRVPRALTKIVMSTPEAARKPLPEFALTSIAGGAKQSFAVLNGKVQRLGDDLGDGWTLSAIDAASGEVEVSGPDDITLTLTLRNDR